MSACDVLVIGGGLHGASTALHCARAGLTVTVLEREAVGRHASGVNAGGVRQLGRHFSEVPLSVLAMRMWESIADLVEDDCGFQQSGQVRIAGTAEQLEAMRTRVGALRAMGFEHEEVVEFDELAQLLPALAPGIPGALMSRRDGYANPYRTTMAFRRMAESLGAVFHEQCPASAVRRDGDGFAIETALGTLRAARVVNCAGAWAGQICAWVGEPVPLQAIAPMMTITSAMPHFVDLVVTYAGRPLSFKQMPNGTVMIGGGYSGTADLRTGLSHLRYDLLAENIRTAIDLFPIMARAQIVRQWAGIEAAMPDQIPVVGASSTTEGLYHAFGFSAHGFQLGPVVGLLLADMICDRPPRLPVNDFAITRFQTATAHHATPGIANEG